MGQLSGKVAVVTGASAPGGIGRAIAVQLAADGAAVAVTDVGGGPPIGHPARSRETHLEEAVTSIIDASGDAAAFTLDVTSAGEIATILDAVEARFGRIDILVNNAGSLAGAGPFLETTAGQWEASFRVNLLGPMMLCQAVIPKMRAVGGGRIINIGSTGSLGGEAGFGAYTAMKHGLVGLSKTVAAEFGADGILCNTVCPGFITTEMHAAANARLATEAGVPIDAIKRQRYDSVAVRDAGKPEDVARAVAYLAGPGGNYVTGINLPVSGGVPFGI